jgi:endonuclease/exonuclease/phosphatase family metal-dependent hydrolase
MRRNEDVQNIIRKADVNYGDTKADLTTAFHHVIWMGDLNYRVATVPSTAALSRHLLSSRRATCAHPHPRCTRECSTKSTRCGTLSR